MSATREVELAAPTPRTAILTWRAHGQGTGLAEDDGTNFCPHLELNASPDQDSRLRDARGGCDHDERRLGARAPPAT